MLHIESEIVPKKEYSSTVMTVFKPVFLADIYGMENGFFSNPLFVVTARFYPAVQKLCCKIKSISNNTLVKKKKNPLKTRCWTDAFTVLSNKNIQLQNCILY